jgi:hypothetical protein
MRAIHRLLTVAVMAVAIGLAAVAGPAAAVEGYNSAQNALFDTNHLEGVTVPSTLIYDFHRSGSLDKGFDDTIEVTVDEVLDSEHRNMSFRFLSGRNRMLFPPLYKFKGNPLIMHFLERDAQQMERLTGGNALYFRNRIRYAFAGDPELRAVTFSHDGKEISGTEITIRPFLKDELRYRYPKFAAKRYIFTLSDEVPGGVHNIRAVTPSKKGSEPLTDESVTFREIKVAKKRVASEER